MGKRRGITFFYIWKPTLMRIRKLGEWAKNRTRGSNHRKESTVVGETVWPGIVLTEKPSKEKSGKGEPEVEFELVIRGKGKIPKDGGIRSEGRGKRQASRLGIKDGKKPFEYRKGGNQQTGSGRGGGELKNWGGRGCAPPLFKVRRDEKWGKRGGVRGD